MTPKQTNYAHVAEGIIKKLAMRQIEGYYVPDAKAAVEKALELMPKGSSIGWGGSMTLAEIGLMDAIKDGSYELFVREEAQTKEEKKAIYSKIVGCDYFLMSSNAITLDGELVNVDGIGSRVAFLCFGPEHVLLFVGMNKVAPNLEAAMSRARNIAAPPNAVRLNMDTPCAKLGRCADCHKPQTICDQIVITRHSMIPDRIKVILIGEDLGY